MSDSKVCPRCKVDKPLTEDFWQRNRTKGNGWQVYCKLCKRAINLERYHALPKAKPVEDPSKVKTCPHCQQSKPLLKAHWQWNNYGWSSYCRDCIRDRLKQLKRDTRLIVLEHYSGGIPKCSCCGVSHTAFLAIDHIHGGGGKHREEVGRSYELYKWIIDNKFPEGFRILCHNCNMAFHQLGYCPHNSPPL